MSLTLQLIEFVTQPKEQVHTLDAEPALDDVAGNVIDHVIIRTALERHDVIDDERAVQHRRIAFGCMGQAIHRHLHIGNGFSSDDIAKNNRVVVGGLQRAFDARRAIFTEQATVEQADRIAIGRIEPERAQLIFP